MARPRVPIEIRLARNSVAREDGCVIWQGAASNGYGRIKREGDNGLTGAHRAAYEVRHGQIPDGMTIDHLCGNTLCVNVDHLRVASYRENNNRGSSPTAINARKTHCIHGHAFDGANTLLRPGGGRQCRACMRESKRRQRAAGR